MEREMCLQLYSVTDVNNGLDEQSQDYSSTQSYKGRLVSSVCDL
jgi:hypothetical protein